MLPDDWERQDVVSVMIIIILPTSFLGYSREEWMEYSACMPHIINNVNEDNLSS